MNSNAGLSDRKPHVRVNMQDLDPDSRIHALVSDYITRTTLRGWNCVENARQVAEKDITEQLYPVALQNCIQDVVQFSKHELKRDVFSWLSM